ncbi:TPA: nicotinate (nicotinamide) nucleotide adenylyltransferase [Candidatus Delongbacteria bacterium]|nr:MAG: nicotinate (nicotinamide) nucleotide adenylyltransferase [Candidatus Delongbacteria bacterium GWF2_40_14]HAQ62064.1 nicotinate (nicotinamide) nucleotide adenylyltransferase [Candidatus Delongbacteria bacterium]
MKKKIGLFGGSFDPIHTAHLIIASVIRQEFDLEKIIFIPNYISPFKENSSTSDISYRIEMIKLSISGNKEFELSDFEALQKRAVYTCETIEYFKSLHPDYDLTLIIGNDAYKTFKKWKNSSYILDNAEIIIAERSEQAVIDPDHAGFRVMISRKCPKIEISSTFIRKMVADNLNIKYLVNEKVRHYIIGKNIYNGNLNKLV